MYTVGKRSQEIYDLKILMLVWEFNTFIKLLEKTPIKPYLGQSITYKLMIKEIFPFSEFHSEVWLLQKFSHNIIS